MTSPRLASLLLLGLTACATSAARMTPPPTLTPPAGAPFEPTGAVSFAAGGEGATVSYGPWRVRGPGIDLAYAGSGTWAGKIADAEVRIVASDGRIAGAGGEVLVDRTGDELRLRGSWSGRTLELKVGRLRLKGALDGGVCAFDLGPAGPDALSGTLGCTLPGSATPTSSQGTLRFRGEAVLVPDVLQPQFVLALLAALPL
jgi:hypothetical protein